VKCQPVGTRAEIHRILTSLSFLVLLVSIISSSLHHLFSSNDQNVDQSLLSSLLLQHERYDI
jgi:hypothetical protein